MTSNIVLSTHEYNVVGTRPIRHDGTDKVTGRAQYGADLQFPDLLHARVLRSPHAHARIKSIDATRALALPGVKAVVTSAELSQPTGKVSDLSEGAMVNPKFLSNNCLAVDKALYKGHAVAAVAATNPHVAEEALSLIDVEYEVLPSVMNVLDAMKEDAPVLHKRLMTLSNPAIRPGGLRSEDDDDEGSNIANHFVFEAGGLGEGVPGGRRRRRARVQHGVRSPGLHRTPHRHGPLERRRQPHPLVQQPGPFQRKGPDG